MPIEIDRPRIPAKGEGEQHARPFSPNINRNNIHPVFDTVNPSNSSDGNGHRAPSPRGPLRGR